MDVTTQTATSPDSEAPRGEARRAMPVAAPARSHLPAAANEAVPHILAVDDEPRTLYALKELLDAPEQVVVLASSGEEALQQVLRHDFAVILMDVRMPGMDGFETAQLLRSRERTRRIPIIFLTGASEDIESIFRGYELGAVDYLVKPVLIPEVLRSKVAVFTDLHAKSAELRREVSERMAAEERLRRSEEQLRMLAGHLLSVREEERAHMAREIHDELGQVLTALKMDVSWIAKGLTDDQREIKEKTQSMGRLIDATVKTVRRIAVGLRPEVLDDMGLVAAIGWQTRDFQKRTGIRCKVDLPENVGKFRHEVATAVFRIYQEILTNVVRHSKATRVEVSLAQVQDNLLLEVRDNGVGMPAAEPGGKRSLGLLGMQERALLFGGSVAFDSQPGKGTYVTLTIPLARAR